MGVDFYACHNCGETFADVSDCVFCECGKHWCSEECAKEDGYIKEHCTKYDAYSYDELKFFREKRCGRDSCWDCDCYASTSCNFCREEDFEDHELLNKALELLGITRKDLIERVKDTK